MRLQRFRSTYLEALLQLLWRQWTTLGVFGQVRYAGPRPIDPEALIISTMQFGRYEPRLFDASMEWWMRNGEWLSSTRLKKLQKKLSPIERRALAATVEAVILERRPEKWKRLLTEYDSDLEPRSPVPLFLLQNGEPLPQVGAPDSTFLRFGLERPAFEMRKIAENPRLDLPGNLRIRLRAFFGVSSRAEIALYLLTHESSHPRRVAGQTNYAFASVSSALRQMALSGLVSQRRQGRELEYSLDRQHWQRFFELPKNVSWANWSLVFESLHEIWECLENLKNSRAKESILGSEMRRCASKANALLRKSEVVATFSEDRNQDPEEYLQVLAVDMKRLFEILDAGLRGVQDWE